MCVPRINCDACEVAQQRNPEQRFWTTGSPKKPPCCSSCSRCGNNEECDEADDKEAHRVENCGQGCAGQEGDSCSEFFQLFVLHNVAAAAGGEGTRSGDRGQPLISFIS